MEWQTLFRMRTLNIVRRAILESIYAFPTTLMKYQADFPHPKTYNLILFKANMQKQLGKKSSKYE